MDARETAGRQRQWARVLADSFDTCHIARGSHRACEKTIHSVVPDASGSVTLRLGADTK